MNINQLNVTKSIPPYLLHPGVGATEVFSTRIRAKAMSLSVSTNRLISACIASATIPMLHALTSRYRWNRFVLSYNRGALTLITPPQHIMSTQRLLHPVWRSLLRLHDLYLHVLPGDQRADSGGGGGALVRYERVVVGLSI